jgi:hypothetical protein
MPRIHDTTDQNFEFGPSPFQRWKRLAIVWGILVVLALIALAVTWSAFFKYVPPGKHLVIINKDGAPLDPGEVLAREDQKGILREVQGEGWHFVMPIKHAAQVEDDTLVPPGKVGIVTALGGKSRSGDTELADEGEQGIQRGVLPPGLYRINQHGYKVDLVDATEIKPGYVGVVRRNLGTKGRGLFARENSNEKGYLPKVLQPGLYYINTREFEVIKVEVGFVQTPFHAAADKAKDTSITFSTKGGFPISVDCTVEWEILPEHMPALVAEYGSWKEVEDKVIKVQARGILRDKGIDYGVQDLLEGSTREKFQDDFTKELTQVCKTKNVTVHSAFIRRIDIPPQYLQPIREKQIAIETQLTTKTKEATAETENEMQREKSMIEQEVKKVEAETKLLVAKLEQETQNVGIQTDAEIEKLKADYGNRIANLDADRNKLLGQAEAESSRLKETAKSSLYQMKMDAFSNDADAFLRYTMAQELNPNMVLRLFHSGPGTFWTNMGDKNLSLMMPIAQGAAPSKPVTRKNGPTEGTIDTESPK